MLEARRLHHCKKAAYSNQQDEPNSLLVQEALVPKTLTTDIQRCNNAIFFIYGASQIQNVESLEVSKTENCSLIASARNKLQGHQLRHKIVEEIRKRGLGVSILGCGYQPFGPKERYAHKLVTALIRRRFEVA